ncbi:acyl-ACP--UDP-N-acetylglucosamine O-acyltransferase [Saccharophagus sp. K07]|uniref:acyl-ACP--UDP-N-acetylglucosamine O-acyltransferase n=1 Tax=Saccharophagus sp. K07 TaxID=2283636 RepID=UPI001652380E|nr:acyl-ACP--UDP-N-acetylglucosamine O-acyltransferase [Saccharophagus sp. K07]MBC6904703.1 acyl-ACP--UDP-N-acetylglucosamine O-acyltransferase [Saccharophagus sp. K07]
MNKSDIDPRAVIHPSAILGEGVSVGPFTVIGPDVEIGEGTTIESHVVIKGPTKIGRFNKIFQFSTLGEATPDLKYKGEPTTLTIGDHNVIREGVTIHRGTIQDRGDTLIGNHNLLMAYVHIGHDSVIGNHCILVNNAALAGHVVIDDWAILSGYTLVHQFCKIGAHAFTGMGAAVGKDIPAFVMVAGAPAAARNINVEGLKRRGFTKEDIAALSHAYKTLYRRGLTIDEALVELQEQALHNAHIQTLIDSLKASTRGIVR